MVRLGLVGLSWTKLGLFLLGSLWGLIGGHRNGRGIRVKERVQGEERKRKGK